MIGVDVRSNMREVQADFRARTGAIRDKATVRALNRALEQTATEASRKLRARYTFKHAAVQKAMKKIKATSASLTATLELRGRRISLIEFRARAVNPWNEPGRAHRRTGGGVSVQVKVGGGRKIIPHAFIATTRAGYRGVFIRESEPGAPKLTGGYQPYGVDNRIVNLRSVSLPKAFQERSVLEAVKKVSRDSFEKNYRQQIRFLNSKVG